MGLGPRWPPPTSPISRHAGPHPCDVSAPPYLEHGPRRTRRVALTFDDGPSERTPAILAVLRRFRAKATFFVVGDRVSGREELLRGILRAGHEIGNHSYSHVRLTGDLGAVASDLGEAKAQILAATGYTPCLFRSPWGYLTPVVLRGARSLGMTTVHWDVGSGDWLSPPIGAAAIRSRVLSRVRGGSIVLLHDAGNRPQTVAALPRILEALRSRGHRPVTASRLLGLRIAGGGERDRRAG